MVPLMLNAALHLLPFVQPHMVVEFVNLLTLVQELLIQVIVLELQISNVALNQARPLNMD